MSYCGALHAAYAETQWCQATLHYGYDAESWDVTVLC